jgi:hypothetical protein
MVEQARQAQTGDAELPVENRQHVAQITVVQHAIGRAQIPDRRSRLGAIIGPLLGALFVGLPVPHLYMWSATPFAVGAVVCFIIYRFYTARLKAHPDLA